MPIFTAVGGFCAQVHIRIDCFCCYVSLLIMGMPVYHFGGIAKMVLLVKAFLACHGTLGIRWCQVEAGIDILVVIRKLMCTRTCAVAGTLTSGRRHLS